MSVRPSALPKVRRQLLRHLDDAQMPIRANSGDTLQEGLDVLASHLRAAEMYWIAPDMTALAMSSGEQLEEASWDTGARPAPCGLLWWSEGVGAVDYQGVQIPVEACTWGPHDGQLAVWLHISRARLEHLTREAPFSLVAEQVPPLIPISGTHFPVDGPISLDELHADTPRSIAAALAASWLLMQQPLLLERTRQRADGPTRRQHARDGLPAPDVTVVDLRRQYVPQDRDPETDGEGRRYRHRWVVSGHWRNQAHGPDRSLRRKQWIPSYVKGPEGAPLLSTERVNVWRR